MHWWQVGLSANAVVAVAYLFIAAAILRPLLRDGQVRSNRLGAATAAIFITCAIHHGGHSVHMLLPYAGVERVQGLAMRVAYDWEAGIWDVITALVGIYYWTMRRSYAPLMRGAQLFEDLRQREQQALELNDTVLQGLVVAKMALELERVDTATAALDSAIDSASRMIGDLLGARTVPAAGAGLLRTKAATLDGAGDRPDQVERTDRTGKVQE